MTEPSTKTIKSGKKQFEPADFHRLFKYLPQNVLRKFTNIEKLIVAEYQKKHNKPPPNIYINKTIKKYHRKISKDDWNEPIFDRIDFNWSKKSKIHASIWLQSKKEQNRIHRHATDHQLKFIYLPLFVYEEATNIEKLMYNEAVKCGKDLNLVKSYVKGLYDYLHIIGGWHSFLSELEFTTDQSSDVEVIEEQTSKSANNNIELKSLEPVASTSKQADVIKRSKPPEPKPSTSKEANQSTRSIANTSKPTDLMPSKKNDSNSAKKSDSASAKTLEIPKTTRKRKPSQNNAVNPKRPSPDLEKRQSESNQCTTKDNEEATVESASTEVATAESANSSTKRKLVQGTLPDWLNSVNAVQKPAKDQSPLAKRPKKHDLERVLRNQNHDLSAENLNVSSKVNKTITSTAADDGRQIENDVSNEERQIEQISDAPNDQPNIETVDENVPPAEISSESQLNAQIPEFTRNEPDEYEPSEFQREVQDMTYDEFVTKTNIKEIVKNAHRAANNVTEEDRLRFFYDFRMQTNNWHRNAIKNLKYIECECKRKSNQTQEPNTSSDKHSKQSNANHSQLSKASSGRQTDYEPSEFQKEIIAMDFETFVHETNAAELVEQEFNKQFNGKKEFTQIMLDSGLQQFFKFKNRLQKKYINVLRNLKYKVCDCRRNKTFVDKSIQTDEPMVYDMAVQCDNERAQTVQLKLASLSIHRNTDAIEIPSSESSEVSSTQDMDRTTQGESMSAGNVTGFGQEVQLPTPETSGRQETTSQVTTISHKQGPTSSQDIPPPQSQPIFSSDQVQLTELMLSSPVQQIGRTNPIKTIAENVIDENVVNASAQVTSPHTNDVSFSDRSSVIEDQNTEFNDGQETIYTSAIGASQIQSTPTSQHQSVIVTPDSIAQSTQEPKSNNNNEAVPKAEPNSLEYHLGDDSDVVFVPISEEIFEISDHLNTQEQFLAMPGDSQESQHSNQRDSLITVHTQSDGRDAGEEVDQQASERENQNEVAYDVEVEANEQANENLNEANESAVEHQLNASLLIEDSDDSANGSPTRMAAKILALKKRASARNFVAQFERLRFAYTEDEDPFANIPGPRNDYQPLEFIMRSRSETVQRQIQNNQLARIVESQPSPDSSRNYVIEDSSSMDDTNGMVTDSCVERANLLNQDNTLFLDINTQLMANSPAVSQVNQPTTSTDIVTTPSTLPEPGLSRLSSFDDQTEFLHHIDIQSVLSNFKNVLLPNGARGNQLNIEAVLKHQCNGRNRIVINGDALKLIMRMNDKEWDALCGILADLENYHYDTNRQTTPNDNILQRTLYYLFKTTPKISTAHIAYGDQDFETARVFNKPNHSSGDLTAAIDPYVLSMMKQRAQEDTN